jgi:hypothetical protein
LRLTLNPKKANIKRLILLLLRVQSAKRFPFRLLIQKQRGWLELVNDLKECAP